MAYEKVQPGQPTSFKAVDWNTLMEMAVWYRATYGGRRGRGQGGYEPEGVILIRNASSIDIAPNGALGISGILWKPSDNLEEFRKRPAATGVVPAIPVHNGKFAVPIDYIAKGAVGRAIAIGMAVAKVDVVDESHDWADVKPGDVTQLQSREGYGGARIIYKQPGLGTKWAWIRLGERIQSPLLGVTVCRGPHHEEDFTDNRQWVRILNVFASCDPTAAWTLQNAPDIYDECVGDEIGSSSGASSSIASDSSSGAAAPATMPFIVACFNVGNATSRRHEQPGKLVQLTPLTAAGEASSGSSSVAAAPNTIRWACEFIDPTDNGKTCDHSSSSSSSGSSGSSESSSAPSSNSRGSDKSTAIVPASWSPTGYTALFVGESPEVRFDDVLTATVKQANCKLPIDPKFIEVCETGSVEVCGCVADQPVMLGASVKSGKVHVKFSRQANRRLKLVIRLTGIRKGFAGLRFPDRTREQFEANEKFIRSAYPGA